MSELSELRREAARRRHQLRRAERERDAARVDLLRIVLRDVLHEPGDLARHGLLHRVFDTEGHLDDAGLTGALADLLHERPELGKVGALEMGICSSMVNG